MARKVIYDCEGDLGQIVLNSPPLNLFDLADNDDYRAYSRRSVAAVQKHGASVVALGRLAGAAEGGDTEPRQAMVLVEWPSRESFDAFMADPESAEIMAAAGLDGHPEFTFLELAAELEA